jgi:hypothetical protein
MTSLVIMFQNGAKVKHTILLHELNIEYNPFAIQAFQGNSKITKFS